MRSTDERSAENGLVGKKKKKNETFRFVAIDKITGIRIFAITLRIPLRRKIDCRVFLPSVLQSEVMFYEKLDYLLRTDIQDT